MSVKLELLILIFVLSYAFSEIQEGSAEYCAKNIENVIYSEHKFVGKIAGIVISLRPYPIT